LNLCIFFVDFVRRNIDVDVSADEGQWKHTYTTWQCYNWRGRVRPTKGVRVYIDEELERREKATAERQANNLPNNAS